MPFLSVCIAVGPSETFIPLQRTLESVACQIGRPVELVIKTVGTHLAKEITEYSKKISEFPITLCTGSDFGIYDALNICTNTANGKYLIFLGCGDELADNFVAEDISQNVNGMHEPNIMYGTVLLSHSQGNIISTFDNSCFFGKRATLPWRNPCHSQGLIYRRRWLIGNPFLINIGPLADLVHTHQHSIHKKAVWLDRPISIFAMGGVSNQKTKAAFNARLRGIMINCKSFRFAPIWRIVSYLVCRLERAIRW